MKAREAGTLAVVGFGLMGWAIPVLPQSQTEKLMPGWLKSEGKYLQLLPPEPITMEPQAPVSFSPTGNYLLLMSMPKKSEAPKSEFGIYSLRTKSYRKVVIGKSPQDPYLIPGLQWLPVGDTVLYQVGRSSPDGSNPVIQICALQASGQIVRVLATVPGQEGRHLELSPGGTRLFVHPPRVVEKDSMQHGVLTEVSSGRTTPVSYPPGRTTFSGWDQEQPVVVTYSRNSANKPISTYLRWNGTSWGPPRRSMDEFMREFDESRKKKESLIVQPIDARPNYGADPSNIWGCVALFSEGQAIIVSGDGNLGTLSPAKNAVSFISQGVCMLRRIRSLDAVAYNTEKTEAAIEQLKKQGKEIAVGIILYATDCDDAFPPGDGFRDKVFPYMRNGSILDGFTYTFGGGLLGDRKPGETQVGYLPGPGGRLIVLADGSVRWVPG